MMLGRVNTPGYNREIIFEELKSTLCSEKNTHSHFLSYLHEWWVDLKKISVNIPKEWQILTM